MDWNTRASHTSSLQRKNFQVWGSDSSQQLTATCNFSQANSTAPYPGSEQTIKMHSNTNNKVVSQLLLQHTGQSLNYQPVFQKTSVSATDFRMPQNLVDRSPVSSTQLSNVQTQGGIVQNPWPNSNIHVFSSAAIAGTTVNSVQSTPQTLYMAPVMYSNCPQKNSNSIRTSVHPQASKSSSFSKRQLITKPSYHLIGPSTSQACATVPLNPASSHHLNSQQNLSCCIIPSGQNNLNQINGLPGSAVAMTLQQYTSGQVTSTPYTVSTHSYKDAAQVIPPVANINPPPPYLAHSVQRNYGHLAQPVANTSNENVQKNTNLGLDQISSEQSMRYYQKPQSEQSARETNEVGGTAYCVNEYRVVDQPSNESAKSLIPVSETVCKNMQISTSQATKTLVQEENLPNSSGNLRNIPKARLVMDIQNLTDFENVLHQFKDLEIKHRLYITVVKNTKTSGSSAHNENSVSIPPHSNTTQNETFLLPHDAKQAFKAPSQDAVLNQPLPLASQGSSQIHNVPLSKRKEHLYPILKDLLQGTVDEDLLNTFATEVGKHQSGNATGGNKCENDMRSNEETFRASPKTSPTVPTQDPLMGTKNSPEQPSRSAKNQSANIQAVPEGGLLHHFRVNKEKILARLSSSVQNPATSNGSSPSSTKTAVKECREKLQCLATMYPEFQQIQNTCLQAPEKNVTIKTSESVSDASSLALPVAKTAVTTPEAGIVQKPSMTGNSCPVKRAYSWEELKASLPLWLKNLPSPINELLHDSMESTVSLSSEGDIDKTQQSLENLPDTLAQNDQTTIETNSVDSSLENKLDTVSSSLLKGSEPQVAVVAPLMQSKESTQMEVQKKNLSTLFEVNPIIEEGSVHSLQELTSAVPHTNRERSSMDNCIAVDSVMHQKAAKSTDENGMVKAETNFSYDYSFLELKKVKSEVCPGEEINCLNPVSQKYEPSHESDPNLLKPGDTAAVELNDTVLQISSVCTLVQGDVFYNSQIANIFNISPLKSSTKNDDTSEEHVPDLQQNEQQPTLLERDSETKVTTSTEDTLMPSQVSLSKAIAEKPSKDLPGLEMTQKNEINARKSEEEKSNYLHDGIAISEKEPEQKFSYGGVCSIDLASGDQELSENQDLSSTAVEDSICAIAKENFQEHVLMEENHAQCSTNSESPVTLLNDQLTELLKEYPNGINDFELQQKTEIKNAIKSAEREDKEETQTCEQNPGPSDAIDQMKILLNSYFPEHVQSSNKLKNSENEILRDAEDKNSLSSDNISYIQTRQLKHVDNTNATAETVVKTESETHCCMQGFMASRYAVKPCSCKLAKDVSLKPKMDLLLQSKNMPEDKPKGSESYKTDCRPSNPLQTSILHPVDSASSGDQSNKFLKNTETDLQVKESTLSKVNHEFTPSSFLEKLDPHKPKRTNEQERKVLLFSAGSQALQEEAAEIKTNDQIHLKEDICSDQPHLSTQSFEKVAEQLFSKKESSHNERRNGMVAISKADSRYHHNKEMKHSRKYERYKIKQDTSETHMIKGPKRRSKDLKRQMAMERKHKVLRIQHSTTMNSVNLGNAGLVSDGYKNSWHNSTLHSEEHFTKQKWENSNIILEKNNETKGLETNEPSNSEHAQPNKESFQRMNLDKFAYSKDRENTWKYKRLLLNNRKIPKIQKQRGHFSSVHKINSFSKEAVLDAHAHRDEWSGRSLSEKTTSFSKRISKLTLQKEQKKSYLNRVSFTQTAQESICLKKLEPSPSKSVWRMKSSSVSGNMEVPKTSSSFPLQPRREKPHMLEFKMCPEILFRTSVSEEQVADSKKLPEKDKTPITAVKSKREDWLNYSPTKRRKTVESETQVDDHIPLDTALKLLDEAHSLPVKDSKTTFQTYRKMHLEKRSRSLDSSPII
ncbi:retroelement silencing factor 1 [Tiliqua scincoides]|uniref:retroelement silencing factor 1 n=1 Tax=Tiliqua scincoides TaxID=71010 RepID=UPI00346331DF